jgi:Flp pilus assembly protein TadG
MTSARLLTRALGYLRRERGSAAVEFAIWIACLVPIVANALDLGIYAFEKVQVSAAGQSAAQAAWTTWYANACTYPTKTVANCGGNGTISTAVGNAINQSTVLGLASPSQITEVTANETSGYYCPLATTNALTVVTPAGGNCPSGSANAGAKVGFYYKLQVRFTYRPLFGAASVASLLGTTMTQDTWIRLQ